MKKKFVIVVTWILMAVMVVGCGSAATEQGNIDRSKVQTEDSAKNTEKEKSPEKKADQKAAKEAVEISQSKPKQAAKLLNTVEDKGIFEEALRDILDKYYTKQAGKKTETFTSAVSERADEICLNYKDAAEERKNADELNFVSGQVLVVFKESASQNKIEETAEALRGECSSVTALTEEKKLAIYDISLEYTVSHAETAYAEMDKVLYTQPNYIFTSSEDPQDEQKQTDSEKAGAKETAAQVKSNSDGKEKAQQWYLANIGAESAWEYIKDKSNEKVKVAVIDSGIKRDHEDLQEAYNGEDSRKVSTYNGKTTVERLAIDDNDGHGTHVAGIIAATYQNGKGIAGVASKEKGNASSDCGLTDLIIIDADMEDNPSSFRTTDIVQGIRYAAETGAKIVNMSLSVSCKDMVMEDVIAEYSDGGDDDMLFVTAAGNESTEGYVSPSDAQNVVSVISTDKNDRKSDFSNYGYEKDIAAPGELIISTYNATNSAYVKMDGTSMATPIVSGAAAMLYYANPDLTLRQVKNILYSSADTAEGTSYDYNKGFGDLNMAEAVKAAMKEGTADAEALELNRGSATIYQGETLQLEYAFKNPEAYKSTVTWSASGDNIEVDENGRITALNAGEATVTASIDGTDYSAQCRVKVKEYPNTDITEAAKGEGFTAINEFTADSPMSKDRRGTVQGQTHRTYMNGYSVKLDAGDKISLLAERYEPEKFEEELDLVIKVYYGDSQVAYNDDLSTNDIDSYLEYTAQEAGTYYIEITQRINLLQPYKFTAKINGDGSLNPVASVDDLNATLSSGNKALLTWTPVGSKYAEGYCIFVSTSYYGDYGICDVVEGGNAGSYLASGLTAGKTYYFMVTTYNGIHTGNDSNRAGVTAIRNVTGFKAVLNTYNSAKLSWNRLTNNYGYSLVDGYEIVYKKASSKTWSKKYVSAKSSSATISKLAKGTKYQFKIRGYININGSKKGGYYTGVKAVITLKAPGLVLGKKGTKSIKVRWSNISGESGYQIYRKVSGGSWKKVKTMAAGKTTWTDGGKKKGRTYYYKVRAYKKVSSKVVYGPFSKTKKIKR